MKLLFRIIVCFIVGAIVINQLINNAVVELYSPDWVSHSSLEAHNKGVLVSRPVLKNNIILWEKSKYSIREVWIEKATRIKYELLFFQHVIPTGYRLLLKIDPKGKPPGKDFSSLWVGGEYYLMCNDSIGISRRTGDDIWYVEISPPVPNSILCSVKKEVIHP